MRNKTRFNLVLSAALLALFFAAVVINAFFGMVHPARRLSASGICLAAEDGSICILQETGEAVLAETGEEICRFPSRPLYAGFCGGRLYAACENRTIYAAEKGEVFASREINYRPTALYVDETGVFVSATQAADRNKIYRLDADTLGYIDLTPGEDHAGRGENEPEINYNERIYALSVETPVVGLNVYREEIMCITAYGGAALYGLDGVRIDRRATEYNFSFAAFDDSGNAYIADDNGGVLGFTAELSPVEYRKLSDSAFVGIAVFEGGAAVATRSGEVLRLHEDLSGDYSVQTGAKLSGFCADEGQISLMSATGEFISYRWQGLSRMPWMLALEIVLSVLLAAAVVYFVFSLLHVVRPARHAALTAGLKGVAKKIFLGKMAYLLLLPTLAISLLFAYYPAIQGFLLAFFNVELGGVNTFAGLDNFRELLAKDYFWSGLGNMLVFLVTDIVKGIVPAFIFAELIIAMRSKRAQYLTRVLLYLPGIIPGVAMLLIWQSGIFGMDGLVNGVVELFGGKPQQWLGQPSTAMASLIFFGFPWIGSYIILYGSLMGVPVSFYEAAKLDGCSWWRRLISIDLPLISPQLKYIFVTSFIGSVQDFQRVYMTTEGAHGTYIPMLELYYNLTLFNNLGVAAAMGLVLFAVLMIATIINLKLKTVDSFD